MTARPFDHEAEDHEFGDPRGQVPHGDPGPAGARSSEGSGEGYGPDDGEGRYVPDRYGEDRSEDGRDSGRAHDPAPEHRDDRERPAQPDGHRRGRHQPADVEELLQRVIDVVTSARSLPLSTSAAINRDEVLDLLEECQERLPVELREARWLRKEREGYLEKMRADGDEIIEHARARVEQMVQRSEIAKSAEHRARKILDGADAEARRLILEAEDYCDQKLARFEDVLEQTLKTVHRGRSRLQSTGARDGARVVDDPES